MSTQRSQQELAELLNLTSTNTTNSEPETDLEPTHLDLIEEAENSEPDESPDKSNKSFGEGISRLLFIAGGAGIAVLSIVAFFTIGMNLQGKTAAVVVEEETQMQTSVTPEEKQNENYRVQIALGDQKKDFERIDQMKAEKIQLAAPVLKSEAKPQPPKPQPKPIAQPPKPAPRAAIKPIRQSAPPKPKIRASVTKPAQPQYDSLSDWHQLASIGSYGALRDDSVNTKTVSNRPTQVARRKVMPSSNLSPYLLASRERDFDNLSPIARANYQSEIDVISGEAKAISVLKSITSTEAKQTVPTRSAAINQKLEAKLLNPIQWIDSESDSYTSFLDLETDLLDKKGNVSIPNGSQLIYEIENVSKNGVIKGHVTGAIVDGREIVIPKGAISIRNKKGGLLVAKYKTIKNTPGNRDILRFATSAIGSVSEIIARPKTSSSSTTSFGTSISTDYGDPDYLESAISKGAADALEGRVAEMEQTYSNAPELNVWELKENTKLTLLVNRSFRI